MARRRPTNATATTPTPTPTHTPTPPPLPHPATGIATATTTTTTTQLPTTRLPVQSKCLDTHFTSTTHALFLLRSEVGLDFFDLVAPPSVSPSDSAQHKSRVRTTHANHGAPSNASGVSGSRPSSPERIMRALSASTPTALPDKALGSTSMSRRPSQKQQSLAKTASAMRRSGLGAGSFYATLGHIARSGDFNHSDRRRCRTALGRSHAHPLRRDVCIASDLVRINVCHGRYRPSCVRNATLEQKCCNRYGAL